MALHHIAVDKTSSEIEAIRSGATAENSLWYYDTDNDLLYYHRQSDNKLIGPVGARQIIDLDRQIAAAADSFSRLGKIVTTEGVVNITVVLTAEDATFRHSSIYYIARYDKGSNQSFQTVLPVNGTGTDNSMKIGLQVARTNGDFELRVKRLSGTTAAINCSVRIYNNREEEFTWTDNTATGSDASSNLYAETPLTQINGKVGLHIIPSVADVDTEIDKTVLMHEHLSIGLAHPDIANSSRPFLNISQWSASKDSLHITSVGGDILYTKNVKDGGHLDQHFTLTNNFQKKFQRKTSANYSGPYLDFIAQKEDGSSNPAALAASEIPFRWTNYTTNLFQIYGDGRLTAPKYVNTLDDTGTATPENFLYSGANGEIYSAPIGKSLGKTNYHFLDTATNVDMDRNTINLVNVDNSIAGQITLPTASLKKGDRVWIKFYNGNTSNTLTINAGGSNTIDGSASSVTLPKGDAMLFIWMGSGSLEQWHRMAEFNN